MDTTIDEFQAPDTLTPTDLGDHLARLVWESFSDFMAAGDAEISLAKLGVPTDDGVPPQHTVEEALIFLMWAHTRGAQLAFMGRAPDHLLHETLDALHSAIFEDMATQGTPLVQLPLFEQRVSARYTEYNQAAERSDAELGGRVAVHLVGSATEHELATGLAERARAAANPLRDYLEEVELVEA
ncbi:MAG: hypothetical protein RQ745_05765 [Longimicrobiales bacterium]|nr:hypothetical protein [Longimicrobiales bacterium]